ncbi:hypothetical protein [Stenotrophomonas sp. CC22-02]|uniref:hypothetical protein n=1 Tax=Stenotrophomonas sp. CC22-02 TaxID=1378087 RepID=UPI00106275BF|nr:hypothetical protein [Stenotrophomonas sp. CC22-02]TDV29233.1 hypothetical protein N440_0004 [Stenotrophomonas sp. CC22-02]
MRLFLLACVAALSLGGCEKSSTTSITRTQANGVDTLHSKGTVVEGQARFQCIASRSGQCHYVVLDPACSTDAACARPPLRRFAVAVGKTEAMRDLPKGFRQCVSQDPIEQCHRE